MRLFIAIQLSEDMKREVCRIQDVFRRKGVTGNYTKEENLHLTLAFIGEYPDAEPILDILDVLSLTPFEIKLEGIGAFGDLWWVGLQKCEPLNTYVKSLRRALADGGIPYDRKRFLPHITLIRRAVQGREGTPGIQVRPAYMYVERVVLMRSDRGKDGMIYTEIGY